MIRWYQYLWKDCNMIFDLQSQLVAHVDSESIEAIQKEYVCYWRDLIQERIQASLCRNCVITSKVTQKNNRIRVI